MKNETIKMLTSAADKAQKMCITKESNFLEIVYQLDEVSRIGETDPRAIIAAHNMLVALNVMRTTEQVFAEKFATRTLAVKMNLLNFMRQTIETCNSSSTYERILAYKSAKTSLDAAAYQLVILQQKRGIPCVEPDAMVGFIALNAQMKYLGDQAEGSIETLEELLNTECLADNLPDEISLNDGLADLPDEITY